jgi:sugar lactone lactonase YvrE
MNVRKVLHVFLFIVSSSSFIVLHAQYSITTFAGNGHDGYSPDGTVATASEVNAYGIAMDEKGNMYFTDNLRNRVRKIDTRGILSTVAGREKLTDNKFSGDGRNADSANLIQPEAVVLRGNDIYISGPQYICKVDSTRTMWTVNGTNFFRTIHDKLTYSETFPDAVAFDNPGNIYIADYANSRIRKATIQNAYVVVAGTGMSGYSGDGGPATLAQLTQPIGVSVDAQGNILIADAYNNCIRKIDATGIITTVAGKGTAGYSGDNGPATKAQLNFPTDMASDVAGNIYITDFNNNVIRKVDTKGIITTIAGNHTSGFSGDGGPATSAQFSHPWRLALDASGNIYIIDQGNLRIRKLTLNK